MQGDVKYLRNICYTRLQCEYIGNLFSFNLIKNLYCLFSGPSHHPNSRCSLICCESANSHRWAMTMNAQMGIFSYQTRITQLYICELHTFQ